MIILGVDPSSTSTGYGLVEYRQRKFRFVDCGCIRPPAGTPFEDRLVLLHHRMAEIVKEWSPNEAAIESTFFGKDAIAAAKLGEARGVLVLAVREAGLAVSNYTPAEVKKSVVGRGRATKQQVRFMVEKILDLRTSPRPLDASDALAIALCHLHQPNLMFPTSGRRPRRPEIEALLKRVKHR